MELDYKKNLSASVYIDNTKLIDSKDARVYGKIDDKNGELFLFIKNPNTGRSVKMIFRQYVEEIETEDI